MNNVPYPYQIKIFSLPRTYVRSGDRWSLSGTSKNPEDEINEWITAHGVMVERVEYKMAQSQPNPNTRVVLHTLILTYMPADQWLTNQRMIHLSQAAIQQALPVAQPQPTASAEDTSTSVDMLALL